MKSRLLVSLLALFAVCFASAQSDGERAQKSAEIFEKATKLDLLNQILPLLFTKEQYRGILPAIEKAREAVRKTEQLEADELKKLESKLNVALKEANDEGKVPPRELLNEVSAALMKMSAARRVIADINVQTVLEAFNKTANAGQKKAAANALNPKLFNPSAKVDEMTDEDKLRVFVREILLHPLAYDIMRKLSI